MGDGVPPEGGLGGRVVDSPVVLGLCPPIPIAFDDPHQLHSYPRLHVHLPSSRRVARGCTAGLKPSQTVRLLPEMARALYNRAVVAARSQLPEPRLDSSTAIF